MLIFPDGASVASLDMTQFGRCSCIARLIYRNHWMWSWITILGFWNVDIAVTVNKASHIFIGLIIHGRNYAAMDLFLLFSIFFRSVFLILLFTD